MTSGPPEPRRLGGRFVLAAAAALLIAVPFTLLLVLVLSRNPELARLDQGVAARAHRFVLGSPPLLSGLRLVSTLAQPWTLRVISIVLAGLLWHRNRRRPAVWLLVTMAVGGAVGGLLKLLVARARPTFVDPVAVAGGYSFPSGHALNSLLFAGCLLVLLHPLLSGRRRAVAWLTATAFVLLVGFDRIGLGVHYVSDVVAGWVVALATILATVAAFGVNRWSDPGRPTQV